MFSRLVEFLCICAGARRDALARAPKGRAQAATLGLLMILTALIAGFTSGYALSRAFLGDEHVRVISIVGGSVWALTVWCLDRLLILGIDRFANTGRLAVQGLARLPLAIIIALVMSTPLVLRISQTLLDADLRRQQREIVAQEVASNRQREGLPEKQKALAETRAAHDHEAERLRQEPDTFRYTNAKAELATVTAEYQKDSPTLVARITAASREIDELGGRDTNELSNSSRLVELRQHLAGWRHELAALQSAVTRAEREKIAASEEWREAETAATNRLAQDLEKARGEESAARARVSKNDQESAEVIQALMVSNLVNQYTTLRRITSDPEQPNAVALRTFEWSLHLFFLALEICIILFKLISKVGPLDHATAAVEFLDKERINLSANSEVLRLQMQAEVADAVLEAALANWKKQKLTSIQAGVVNSGDLKQLREEIEDLAA